MERQILITNDDGILSDGIVRLAECAKEYGEVWVVAPESQRSAASHCITLRSPIDAWPHDFPVEGIHAYASTGFPADCIRIGCLSIMPRKPDLVLTGINYGYNVATDLQYSATAGAAFEASFQGIPAIALSEAGDFEGGIHETTDHYLKEILDELIGKDPGKNQIFNVNFPACPLAECRGILRNRSVSSRAIFEDRYTMEEELPGGRIRYMVKGMPNRECEEGTDFRALMDNYVSMGVVRNVG
ncbi:MAG: 5'/3'-nucleotidase SurE [Lachnospiraceae bacterium]|nr:5'/3'-nucleotidase SurE [Lachnospiraceae bacterium]